MRLLWLNCLSDPYSLSSRIESFKPHSRDSRTGLLRRHQRQWRLVDKCEWDIWCVVSSNTSSSAGVVSSRPDCLYVSRVSQWLGRHWTQHALLFGWTRRSQTTNGNSFNALLLNSTHVQMHNRECLSIELALQDYELRDCLWGNTYHSMVEIPFWHLRTSCSFSMSS